MFAEATAFAVVAHGRFSEKRTVCGNIRSDVFKASCVFSRCGYGKLFAGCRHGRSNRKRIVLCAGKAGDAHSGRECRRKSKGIPGLMFVSCTVVCPVKSTAVLCQGDGGRSKSDAVRQCLSVSRHLKQLIRPCQHMLIARFGTDVGGIGLSVCEVVRAGFAVLTEPETDSACGSLSCLINSEAAWRVAGVSIHQNRLKPCKRNGPEYCGRRSGCIGVTMRIGFECSTQ